MSKDIDKGSGHWRGRAGEIATSNGSMSGANYERTDKGEPVTAAARTWQGWGTALKPAHEPIVCARKPLAGNVAANVLRYGTGALNIDATRVGDGSDSQGARPAHEGSASTRYTDRGAVNIAATPGPRGGSPSGRWPSNVVLSHGACGDTVCAPGCPVAELDRQSGESVSRRANRGNLGAGPFSGIEGSGRLADTDTERGHADSGGASRFFPVFRYAAKAPTFERPRDGTVSHPTTKPLSLMRWLVRLVTPPGGVCLDPFAGSGTTAEACVVEGFRCITVEREAAYLPLIVARLTKPIQPDLFGGES